MPSLSKYDFTKNYNDPASLLFYFSFKLQID